MDGQPLLTVLNMAEERLVKAFSKKKEWSSRSTIGTLFSLQVEWLFIKAMLSRNGKIIYLLADSAALILPGWLLKIIKLLAKKDYWPGWEKDSETLLILIICSTRLLTLVIFTGSVKNNFISIHQRLQNVPA